VARERRLGAREVEEIFTAFAEAMRELPPDVDAGWLLISRASYAPLGAFAKFFRTGGGAKASVNPG